jgi:hypothetical protein
MAMLPRVPTPSLSIVVAGYSGGVQSFEVRAGAILNSGICVSMDVGMRKGGAADNGTRKHLECPIKDLHLYMSLTQQISPLLASYVRASP